MKSNDKQALPTSILLTLTAALAVQAANAAVTTDSTVDIGYSISKAANLNPSHAGDLSNLAISGSFQQLNDANGFAASVSGDGGYTVDNTDIGPVPVLTGFSHSFTVSSGSLNYGTADTFHTGLFSLDFFNTGSDSYSIEVSLNYLLSSISSGLYAGSAIQLDYWDSANSMVAGQDSLSLATYPGNSYASSNRNGTADLVFTLDAGGRNSFMVQAAILTTVDNTMAAPVPLPTAVWCFLGGLMGLLGIRKHKKPR